MTLTDRFRSLLDSSSRPAALDGSCCTAEPASDCCTGPEPSACCGPAPRQELAVVVKRGYTPARLTAKAGAPIRITFLRDEISGCSKEVVFPALGIRRALPTGERVAIDLPPQPAGVLLFTCGMAMLKGGIEIR